MHTQYSTPPARVSCGERRAFGDPPAITKEKTPRTDRESLVQRLSNPRRIDADRQRDARDMSDKRESPQRKREHGFKNVIAQRDSVRHLFPFFCSVFHLSGFSILVHPPEAAFFDKKKHTNTGSLGHTTRR